jgi:hypothetical protein
VGDNFLDTADRDPVRLVVGARVAVRAVEIPVPPVSAAVLRTEPIVALGALDVQRPIGVVAVAYGRQEDARSAKSSR